MDTELLTKELSDIVKSEFEKVDGIVADKVSNEVKTIMAGLAAERALYGKDKTGLSSEYKKQLGEDLKAIIDGQETKAVLVTYDDTTGGYLIPEPVMQGILNIAEVNGYVMAMCDVMDIPGKITLARDDGSELYGAYYGEDAEGTSESLDLKNIVLDPKEWRTFARISNKLIAHSPTSVADYMIAKMGRGLSARMDKEAFKGGTFVGSPFIGALASTDVTVHTMSSGNTAFDDFSLADANDMIAALPEAILNDGAFFMHRTVWAKLKNKESVAGYRLFDNTSPILMQYTGGGIKPKGVIEGYPVFTTDYLPAFADSAISTKFAMFVNMKEAFLVGMDKANTSIAQSTEGTLDGKSLFAANQRAYRLINSHAVAIKHPTAIVVAKTAAA